jgi:hypothetical protein
VQTAGVAIAPGVSFAIQTAIQTERHQHDPYGSSLAEQVALNPLAGFGLMLSKSSVRCNTEANYDSQWRGFEA